MSRQFSGFQTKTNCTTGRTGTISLVSMERALNCTKLGLFSNRAFSVTWPGVCKLIATKGSVNMRRGQHQHGGHDVMRKDSINFFGFILALTILLVSSQGVSNQYYEKRS